MRAQQRRHRTHANPFSLQRPIEVPSWTEVFGRQAPMAVDIGFGPGGFLLELARRHPEWNVVGLEIRQHLVDAANRAAEAQALTNLHALLANANFHLDALLPDAVLVFASVNFPDPWFKKRHHKRRVLNPDLVEVLARKMAPGGELHVMSDFAPIAEEILAVLESAPNFTNVNGLGQLAQHSTTGIVSERETKHLQRGDPIYRMAFVRAPIGR